MLPWYMGLMLFQHANHLSLLNIFHQTLHHILKNCVKVFNSKELCKSFYLAAVFPLHKITFSKDFNSSFTIKASVSLTGYKECLKNSKSKGIAHFHIYYLKFLITFPLIVIAIAFFGTNPSF